MEKSSDRREWIKENSDRLIDPKYEKKVGTAYADTLYNARDLAIVHGTYQFEQQMLDHIRHGRTAQLKKFLFQYTEYDSFNEGKVANDDLRQVKNIFIGLAALVGKMAAIPGGMPVEQAYYLIDTYTQHAEALESAEDVYTLQYNMIIDFAERMEQLQYPDAGSPLIRNCINYIHNHLNEPLRSGDVVAFSGRSKSSLSALFKAETGCEIGTFITRAKIDEAKSLLQYTSKPISEISSYLSFSSQPYFQNVFRKITGMTPQSYRNQTNRKTPSK